MKKLLVVLVLAAGFSAYAQKQDFLVKFSGDTVYGSIRFREDRFLVENGPGKSDVYSAHEIQQVWSKSVRNNIVVPCNLHYYSDNIQDMQVKNYRTSDRDTVMILEEIYSTPKMNLYWGTDIYGSQYYFYKTPGDRLPVQLFVKYYLSSDNGETLTLMMSTATAALHMVVQKGYVNQLRLIMDGCGKISAADWDTLDYRGYSLKSLVRKFNKCL